MGMLANVLLMRVILPPLELTLDHLKRKGWFLANRCFLCLEEEKIIDHILIHCVKTRVLWISLFSLFGVLWIPHFVRDTLLG